MIRIGPGGTSGLGYDKGMAYAKELGLSALEVEFTYGVKMTDSEALRIGRIAKESGITLSVHAPYYINLLSSEEEKVTASRKRILDACEKADKLGARCVVFHPGFYQKTDEKTAYEIIKKEIIGLHKYIKEKKWDVTLCPETTGKPSQFGSLKELLQLQKDTGCGITIDFSHIIARTNGKTTFEEILQLAPNNFHAHFSGIEYTDKGERRHIVTTKEFFLPLAKALKKRKELDVTIINESPQPFKDAEMMVKVLKEIK